MSRMSLSLHGTNYRNYFPLQIGSFNRWGRTWKNVISSFQVISYQWVEFKGRVFSKILDFSGFYPFLALEGYFFHVFDRYAFPTADITYIFRNSVRYNKSTRDSVCWRSAEVITPYNTPQFRLLPSLAFDFRKESHVSRGFSSHHSSWNSVFKRFFVIFFYKTG